MKRDESMADLSWLDGLHDQLIPHGYRDAVRVQLTAESRRRAAAVEIDRLETVLDRGVTDHEVGGAQLVKAATGLSAWREIASRADAVEPTPAALHRALLGNLARNIHTELQVPMPVPLYASDLVHYTSAHTGMSTWVRDSIPYVNPHAGAPATVEPVFAAALHAGDLDRAAVDALETASALGVALYRAVTVATTYDEASTEPDDTIAAKVTTLRGLVDVDLPAYIAARTAARDLVERADAEREVRGWRHNCGSQISALPPISSSPARRADGYALPLVPWSLRDLAGADAYDQLTAVPA